MRKIALLLVLLVTLGVSVTATSAAAPAADPNCPGSLVPQLDIATQNPTGHIAHVFSTLRNTPDGSVKQVILAPATFNVFDAASVPAGFSQPSCVDGVWSWYIQYIDVAGQPIGWASESQVLSIWGSNQFWLAPGPIPPPVPPTTPTVCDSSVPFRFATSGGEQGQIAEVFSTLRPAPGVPGEVINAPATFTVYASGNVPAGFTQPTCAGGIAYWYIQYAGTNKFGWASEGNNGVYWLEPVPAPAAAG